MSPLADLKALGALDKLQSICGVDLERTEHALSQDAQACVDTVAALKKMPVPLQLRSLELIISQKVHNKAMCPVCRCAPYQLA